MSQFDGELAALRHQRDMEALGESSITEKMIDGSTVLAEKVGIPFAGFIRKALKSGEIPVEKMIDNLESATYEEVCRIWTYLEGKEKLQEEFALRLDSQEAQTAFMSAVFHGLRTSDPEKHQRLGRLTINCIFMDDLKPESLDDMMRSAVVLTEHDVKVLKSIYEMQVYFFTPTEMAKRYNFRIDSIRDRWKMWWDHEGLACLTDGGAAFRSSMVRLQLAGLIASIGSPSVLHGPIIDDYELLMEGKKFYERVSLA